jgi:DNA primase
MSMTAPRIDFVRVKQEASFETVLERYGITLIGSGAQRRALCPFHRETDPSCSFELKRNVFHCFACGVSGSVIDFVARMEACSLPAAAATIARWCGIVSGDTVPQGTARVGLNIHASSGADDQSNRPLAFTLELDPSHAYFEQRGVPPATVRTFGLGYCARGIMRGRVCIPVHDKDGVLVGYAGRWPTDVVPSGAPRYRLPKGFKKNAVLFNLHRVLRSEHLVIVEGCWSVFRLWELGIAAVALMGRSLSTMQEQLLAASDAGYLTLLFDGDEPGRMASAALLPRLARSWFGRSVDLPEGTQPDTVDETTLRALLAAKSRT